MTVRTPQELGTIVSIWAHPDDETYLAGGVMAAAVRNGQRVVCVSATAGEHGTDDPATWPPERLGAVRRTEGAAAMTILGVAEHRWLDYEDGTLAALDPGEPVTRLAALLEEVGPDTILTFGPDGATFHPDHQTVSRWTEQAWEDSGRPGSVLHSCSTDDFYATWGEMFENFGVYMTDERPVGWQVEHLDVHLVLEGDLLDRKMAALAAMPSQTAGLIDAVGPDVYRAMIDTESFVANHRNALR